MSSVQEDDWVHSFKNENKDSPVLFSVLQQLHSPSPWLLLMWAHLGLWPWKHILQTGQEDVFMCTCSSGSSNECKVRTTSTRLRDFQQESYKQTAGMNERWTVLRCHDWSISQKFGFRCYIQISLIYTVYGCISGNVAVFCYLLLVWKLQSLF